MLTEAQLRALRWLRDNGGHAKPDRWCGMVSPKGVTCPSSPSTFVRLVCSGHVAKSPRAGHLGITQLGLEALK